MNLLIDTHAFLWFCQDAPELTTTAKILMEDSANRKFLSIASCWELAIKAGLGKLNLGEPSHSYVTNALAKTGFELLPISLIHATRVESLPPHHRDPFDRMLVVQAMTENLEIVSADVKLDAYAVIRRW